MFVKNSFFWDSRITTTCDIHDQPDPNVSVGTKEDCYDCYFIRIEEMRLGVQIIRQCPNQMHSGMIKADDRKLCRPARCRMKLPVSHTFC